MIAEYLLETDLKGIKLFDMGCGSGILGILACKRGAASAEMTDNDPDAVQNTIENIGKNNVRNALVHLGGTETIAGSKPDMITANINRPVLLESMATFYRELKQGGLLIISGILRDDAQMIINKATTEGFLLQSTSSKLEWVMCVFNKPETK